MINRRRLLFGMGSASAVALGLARELFRPRLANAGVLPSNLVTDDDVPEQLLYELARLNARYYSEEGVAMVLACEDFVDPSSESYVPGEMNGRFADGFRYYVGLLAQLRSDLVAQDAAALVELLAYRDFASVGESDDE